MKTLRFGLPVVAIALAGTAIAEDIGDLSFKSTIGSFKCLSTGGVPVKGKFTLSLKGTVLVSKPGPNTKVTTTGSIRLEKQYPKYGKSAYFGDGTITVEGEFDSIQVFGKNLNGRFVGRGFIRLYGEFDKNLDTGEYWFAGGDHRPWGTGGTPITVPELSQAAPEIKLNPAKGGAGKSGAASGASGKGGKG